MTLAQASLYLGVSRETVRRWIASGQLPAIRIGIRGPYRVRAEDLNRMVRAA